MPGCGMKLCASHKTDGLKLENTAFDTYFFRRALSTPVLHVVGMLHACAEVVPPRLARSSEYFSLEMCHPVGRGNSGLGTLRSLSRTCGPAGTAGQPQSKAAADAVRVPKVLAPGRRPPNQQSQAGPSKPAAADDTKSGAAPPRQPPSISGPAAPMRSKAAGEGPFALADNSAAPA